MTMAAYDGMEHAGDLISGLLDGELDATTAARVVDHLQRCRPCAEELETTREIRFAVRTLPPQEPPAGFFDAALAGPSSAATGAEVVGLHARTRQRAAASAAASIAAAITLLVLVVGAPSPGVDEGGADGAVALQASIVSMMGRQGVDRSDLGSDLAFQTTSTSTSTSTVPTPAPRTVPEPFVAPEGLDGGYKLVGSFADGPGMHLLYESGSHELAVFERPGRCDFDALPAGGRRMEVGGRAGWRLDAPGVDGRVVVVDDDGLVFVVVGDEEGDAVLDAAASLPGSGSSSTAARLRRAAVTSLEHLSPTG